MLAAYSTRRSSVVLNPRGRVLGGLGEEGGGGDAPGGSGDSSGGGFDTGGGDSGGYTGFALARAEAEMAAIAAAQDAEEAANAAREASYSGSPTAAQALAEAQAAAKDAAMAEEEAAMYANIASISNVASKAALTASSVTAKQVSTVVAGVLGMFGIPGRILSLLESVTGVLGKAIAGTATKSDYTNAQQAIDNARNGAGGDPQLQEQISKVQQSLNAVKNAGVEAAIKQLYATYAHRAVDPGAMKYWSDRFGPTVSPDEVLQFQEFLYANEPNLRPAVVTKITPAAGAGTGLALPLIAAIAGYFILGS